MDSALAELLNAGAVRLLSSRPIVSSPLGVVPKPNSDKFRLIINMRYVNKALVVPKFRMETLSSLATLLKQGDYMVSFDLKSGFWHVPLAPEAQPYVAFSWRGKYYSFCRLPFGLAPFPWAFSKLMRQLVKHWRHQGIRLLPYLDDFLFMASSRWEARLLSQAILRDLFRAGFDVNFEKSVVVPTQLIQHLGLMVNSVSGLFDALDSRWEKLRLSIQNILGAPRHRVQVRHLAGCTGQIISMKLALGPAVHLYTRFLYEVINSAPQWTSWVTTTPEARDELLFWSSSDRELFFGPIWPPSRSVSIRLASDASAVAWGGILLSSSDKPLPRVPVAHEFFSQEEQGQSSTLRELLGIQGTLGAFLDWCQGAEVYIQTDSLNVVHVHMKGSRKRVLNAAAKRLYWFCREHSILLNVNWVPREENQQADDASKLADSDDWCLNPSIFRDLDARWGPHSIDLFASSRNSHCERFFSRYWCPGCLGVNAFSHDWSQENS